MVLQSAVLFGEQLSLRRFTVADGLPSDRVNCIVTDARGFIWFCTDEGLARYDGYSFAVYPINEGTRQRVNCLVQARDGVLWVGLDMGLGRFDPAVNNPRFHIYRAPGVPPVWRVNVLAEDRSGKAAWPDALARPERLSFTSGNRGRERRHPSSGNAPCGWNRGGRPVKSAPDPA